MNDPKQCSAPTNGPFRENKFVQACRYSNAAIVMLAAIFVFLIPGATVIYDLLDPGIRSDSIPRLAWRMHRTLAPKYERWARKRLDSARATTLATDNISGTEWPLFGSVFYLLATESLQEAWEKDNRLGPVAPKIYARGAIEAAARLVIDPKQANWVKIHWGEKYLKTQNLFYRMLTIAALTSYMRLTEDRQYAEMLRERVESLARELDASPHGLLDDYPNQCYPGDVIMAIAMIRKADAVLGADHSAFVGRALRGFQNQALDPHGLVPYAADAQSGAPRGPSRGCGNSYITLFAAGIWPEQARQWYDLYGRHFWQEQWTGAGFREFPNDMTDQDWYFDVDAGPVLKGYGFAACAFGIGAARANGHFEHAYPLTAEMYSVSCPLPDGTLLLPRLLSDGTDAPFLGEACILFILTREPAAGAIPTIGGSIPGFVLIVLALQFLAGLILMAVPAWTLFRQWKQKGLIAPLPQLQFLAWVFLACGAIASLLLGKILFAVLLLLAAQLIPRYRRRGYAPQQR